jgi:3-hydroxyacyl-CoA dehydrogenase
MTDHDPVAWRLVLPSLLDAVALVGDGSVTPEGLDADCRARGRPAPFARLRGSGAGTWLARAAMVNDELRGVPRFEAPAFLVRLAAEPGLLDIAGGSTGPTPSLVQRLDLATINEAYRIVGDGAADPPFLDDLLRAQGWPEGPFDMAGALGLRTVVDVLHALAASDDPGIRDRFGVAPLLWQVATI